MDKNVFWSTISSLSNIENGFVELTSDCPDADGLKFSDYVLKYTYIYIEQNCIFPPKI